MAESVRQEGFAPVGRNLGDRLVIPFLQSQAKGEGFSFANRIFAGFRIGESSFYDGEADGVGGVGYVRLVAIGCTESGGDGGVFLL